MNFFDQAMSRLYQKRMVRRILWLACLLYWLTIPISGEINSFKVKDIRIDGLKRVSNAAVLHRLPIQAGDWFNTSQSDVIIKKLYETQWFDEVQLVHQDNQLKVVVKERPIIIQFTLEGEHGLNKDALDAALKECALVKGQFFNASRLALFKKELINTFAAQGYHAANIQSLVSAESEGSVKVTVTVIPGPILRFSAINVVGNHAFSKKQLLAALPVTACRAWSSDYIWAFITNKSPYCTTHTMHQALESLRLFYRNRGYLAIKIHEAQLSITPDRREADWTIDITEGAIHKIGRYRILGLTDEFSQSELEPLIRFKPEAIYSEQDVLETKNNLKEYFGEHGYTNAKIGIITHIDSSKQRVSFVIQIDPREKVYVRRIDFFGNRYIQDWLLRSLMVQEEAVLVSSKALKDSEQALLEAGVVQSAKIEAVPSEGVKDQMDLRVSVHEQQRTIGLSAGTEGGLGGSVKADNLLGRGDLLNVAVSRIANEVKASLSYQKKLSNIFGLRGAAWGFEGYTTWAWGKKQSAKEMFRKDTDSITASSEPAHSFSHSSDPKHSIQRSNYQINSKGNRFELDFPKDRCGRSFKIGAGFKAHHLNKTQVKDAYSVEVKNFIEDYGSEVRQWVLEGGMHISRLAGSNVYFPSEGELSNILLSVALSGVGQPMHDQSLKSRLAVWTHNRYPINYWKLEYSGFRFWNVKSYETTQHVLGINWHLGIGQQLSWLGGDIPFFDSYYSGRFAGFRQDALGSRDSLGHNLGGSLLVKVRAMYCLPKPFSGDQLDILQLPFPFRTSVFCQVGNVYSNLYEKVKGLSEGRVDFPYALSAGLVAEVVCNLPGVGRIPVFASMAWPILNKTQTYDKKYAQYFNVGVSFLSD